MFKFGENDDFLSMKIGVTSDDYYTVIFITGLTPQLYPGLVVNNGKM